VRAHERDNQQDDTERRDPKTQLTAPKRPAAATSTALLHSLPSLLLLLLLLPLVLPLRSFAPAEAPTAAVALFTGCTWRMYFSITADK